MTPRAYHSPKREQAALETRRAIRSAAEELFLRHGYGPTTMKAIALQAGVVERTVFLVFPSKAALLSEIIRVAVRGDDDATAMADRPAWQAMLSAPPEQIIPRYVALNAALMMRTARFLALGEAAATVDPDLEEFRDRGRLATRTDLQAIASSLFRNGVPAGGISEQQAGDTIYALAANEQLFLRLTDDCAWTEQQYAALLERTLNAALGL